VQFLIAKIKKCKEKISEASGLKTAYLAIKMASKAINRSQTENKNNSCPNSKHYESMKLN
jgi:hypothetical protein